jgi:hypothetical protein
LGSRIGVPNEIGNLAVRAAVRGQAMLKPPVPVWCMKIRFAFSSAFYYIYIINHDRVPHERYLGWKIWAIVITAPDRRWAPISFYAFSVGKPSQERLRKLEDREESPAVDGLWAYLDKRDFASFPALLRKKKGGVDQYGEAKGSQINSQADGRHDQENNKAGDIGPTVTCSQINDHVNGIMQWQKPSGFFGFRTIPDSPSRSISDITTTR